MIWALLACTTSPADTASSPPACVAQAWSPDRDADGYGDAAGTVEACEAPAGFVANAEDCDDGAATAHPGAVEACNSRDDDCDGTGDPGAVSWADADGDGYGDPATAACVAGAGRVTDATDCDDADAATHPGADEGCDGADANCDGAPDAAPLVTAYPDPDADGYGADADALVTCAPPAGATLLGGDCAPEDPAVHPDAPESCNDADDDCDGDTDEGCLIIGDVYLSDADARVSGDVGDDLGRQLKVGDVTGDGVDDLVTGTLSRGGIGGAAVLPGGVLASGDIDALGFRIEAGAASSGASRSIGVGDVDGDGIADISIGVPYATADGVRILLGPVTGDRTLESGLWLSAPTGVFAGHGGDLGDVDGDGIEDAVVGAHADSEGGSWAGAVYVAYGPLTAGVDLGTDADARLVSDEAGSATGRWIRADGDYNGDGVSDVLVASPLSSIAGTQAGAAYVVYGPPADGLRFSEADCRFFSTRPGDYFGTGIGHGDVNGDGTDDVLLGGSGSGTAGSAYVFLTPGGMLTTADADLSFAGVSVAESLGTDLRAGDLDGDGAGDLLLGAYGAAAYDGAVYLFRGPAPGSYGPADADVVLRGRGRETAGVSVQLGDLDADGTLEALVGAPAYAGAGAVYVFGGL
jgi:hypothetical protein